MRRTMMAIGCLAVVLTGAGVLALEGLDGTTVTALFDESGVQTDLGWTDQEMFALGASARRGDAVAGSSSGDVYFIVYGETPSDPEDPNPLRTALVRDDGTEFVELLRHVRNQGTGSQAQVGKEIRVVAVSPCTAGRLTAGQPVILRWSVTKDADGVLVCVVDLVAVDSTGEDVLTSFDVSAADATLAIDGGGTIFVGPMSDGSIARVAHVAGDYATSTVSTSHDAGILIEVDSNGDLYTFAKGVSSSAAGSDRTVYRIDPDTGTASSFAAIDGSVSFYDLAWSGGKLWVGCRHALVKGKKPMRRFVAPVAQGDTVTVDDAITDSTHDPCSVGAGADGALLVLETIVGMDDTVYEVVPGEGGGDGGKPPKKPKK